MKEYSRSQTPPSFLDLLPRLFIEGRKADQAQWWVWFRGMQTEGADRVRLKVMGSTGMHEVILTLVD